MTSALDRGRSAYERQDFAAAFGALAEADDEQPLGPDDLEAMAMSADMLGRDEDGERAWERCHHANVAAGRIERAVRCVFWLNFGLINRGEFARASGWMATGQRLLADRHLDCVEEGYLLLPVALQLTIGGDATAGMATFERAAKIAGRFDEPDLLALARNGRGRSLLELGEFDRGMETLDELMLAVTGGELSPVVTGSLYCSVIEACHEVVDLPRAREWTAALGAWSDAHADAAPFRGKCLVYRSELLRLRGDWQAAAEEVEAACQCLAEPTPRPSLGAAHYLRAELDRLTGDLAAAERGYRAASRWGRDPQPGLALLRRDQGRAASARDTLQRALTEQHAPATRASLLAAQVEVLLEGGDVDGARHAATELDEIGHELGSKAVRAAAARAAGAVALADGDPAGALPALRRAAATWIELGARYEDARTRELIGRCCEALGDPDGASLELAAAAETFGALGARTDLARLRADPPPAAAGLTDRELEVLALVAAGMTNRAIADELVISQKTVATHVSHILAKLGAPNRSAATAYAHEHGLT